MTLAQFALGCTFLAWALVFVKIDRRIALALFVGLSLVGGTFVIFGGLAYAWESTPPPSAMHRTMLLHGALILAAQLVGFLRLGARSSRADRGSPTTRL
jgi:hypothetical protein